MFSSKELNSCILPINGSLTGTTTPGLNRSESNDNEGVLHIPQTSRTEASLSHGLVSYQGHSFWGGVLLLFRDAVGIPPPFL